MVSLKFNAHAWSFQAGLRTIISSYDAAHAALQAKIVEARNNIDDYATAIETGGEWEGERDEEGHVLWSKDQVLEYHHDEAVSAASTLRRAYVLVLYHHWERNALKWVDREQLKHYDLVQAVKDMGYPVANDLELLYLLSNMLKHNRRVWGERLANRTLRYFMFQKRPSDARKYWDDAVVVGPHHINQFFQIVGWSGPQTETWPGI